VKFQKEGREEGTCERVRERFEEREVFTEKQLKIEHKRVQRLKKGGKSVGKKSHQLEKSREKRIFTEKKQDAKKKGEIEKKKS